MDRVSICTCCLEHGKVIAKKVEQNISCIIQYPDFAAAILNCLTLETVYHQFKQKVRERGWELQEKLSKKKKKSKLKFMVIFSLTCCFD